MSMTQNVRASGAVSSTNARINVNIGFKPSWVRLLNSANVSEMEWHAGMPSDSAVRRSGAANPSYITSSGIKLVDDGTNIGFSVGPDSQFNPTGSNEIFWVAVRGHDPK